VIGEQLPAIGMDSWITFNVGGDGERELNPRQKDYVPIHVPPASLSLRRAGVTPELPPWQRHRALSTV
jgi:hypothetical protein